MSKHEKSDEREKALPEGLRAEDFSGEAQAPAFEAGTLSGDVRDVVLSHIRTMTVPWAMLNEQEQYDKIEAATRCGEHVVREAMASIVAAGFPSVVVSVGSIKIDKGVEIKLSSASTLEAINKLAAHGKASAVLVLAEASEFFGERAPQKAQKNQPDLPLEEGDDA